MDASPATTTFIQWKGTDVCISVRCSCGTHSHFDGYFLYFYRCPGCQQLYEVGTAVTLTPIDRLRDEDAEGAIKMGDVC